jgi:APA family basic amino acid/polyamine antiporter
VFINAAYFYVLTPLEVASVPESASVAGEVVFRFLGAGAASIMAVGLMLSSFGALHSNVLTVARVPYALARNGLLPRWVARVSSGSHVPVSGVLIVAGFAVAFSLSGTFDVLTDLIVFGLLIFNGLAVAAVFVLRKKLPDSPRPYKVWGYPFVPFLFLLATVYLMINTLVATPGRAVVGLVIIAAGLPIYAYYARKRGPSRLEDFLGEDSENGNPTDAEA